MEKNIDQQMNNIDDIINQVLNSKIVFDNEELENCLYSKLFLVIEKLNFCIENPEWKTEIEKQKAEINQLILDINQYKGQENFSAVIGNKIIQNQIKSIINHPSSGLLNNNIQSIINQMLKQ